jgi:hypothetical protein
MAFIQSIAAAITEKVPEQEILRKSLQECFYFIVGTDTELSVENAIGRLRAFLKRYGTAGFLKRFLSVHLFNVIWLEAGDSMRVAEWTQRSFLRDIDNLERVCRRMVSTVWKSLNISGPLDSASALSLVDAIGKRLTRS